MNKRWLLSTLVPALKPTFAATIMATALLSSGCQSLTQQPQPANSVEAEHQQAKQQVVLKIATITPVVESITQSLTENTEIELVYLPSQRYSIKRIPGWLKKQDHNAFPEVDAVAGISSVWSELDAYPSFRLQNIQVVPIDLAHALVPGGERVAITQQDNSLEAQTPSYFWLNPSNALIMVGILSRDLKALINQMPYSPETRDTLISTINLNQANINTSLREFQVALDQTLMDQGFMQVTTDKPELNELLAATLLPDVSLEEAKQGDFPTLLITSRKTSHKSYRTLPSHIKVWSIDDFGKVKPGSFSERWANTLKSLNTI
ncbi:hypothetical protein ACFOEK_02025 [Litoribrevibacter euphylliae]|uniref:Metal ABC transporter substrate-binding protein n=1 Tax=Litoribrevibacter euphylliae TaxID=1834034 RepID=A0ABV7HB86_9GAMM